MCSRAPLRFSKQILFALSDFLEQHWLQKHQVKPKQIPGMPLCRIVLAGCANASDLQVIALVMSTERH